MFIYTRRKNSNRDYVAKKKKNNVNVNFSILYPTTQRVIYFKNKRAAIQVIYNYTNILLAILDLIANDIAEAVRLSDLYLSICYLCSHI